MKVYVLETGYHGEQAIHGVYATLEGAMAAWQPKPDPRGGYTYTWREGTVLEYDADLDHAATITEYEVK